MNRITKTITAAAVSVLTCLTAGVTVFADVPSDDELSALRWGMTAEELEAAVITPCDRIETAEFENENQTHYIYEDVSFKGHDGYLLLCVTDVFGFDGVNYYLYTDDGDSLYAELAQELTEESGKFDPVIDSESGGYAFWHFDDRDYTIMLCNYGTEVQYSYFRLFEENERYYNQADASISQEGLNALQWGMTAEEVEGAITALPDKVERVESAGLMQTLYTYECVEDDGYYWYVILCVTDENGFEGINYHFPTDDTDSLYAELSEVCADEGGMYDPTTDEFSFWHFDEKGHTVMLFNLGTEVQFSVFPLFPESDRGYNYNESGEYEPSEQPVKESPDTGISDTSVVIGIGLIAIGAAVIFRRKK